MNWEKTINIKQFLAVEPEDENVPAVAEQIVNEFQKHYAIGANQRLDDILDYLLDQDCVEGFDYELDDLYDWADKNCVWLGM